MKIKLASLILLSTLLISASLYATEIQVKVDRNQIELNETFTLVFEANEDPDDDPDFSPLEKDFKILNKSSSSNISIVNGNYTKQKRWSVTLMALKKGEVTIPSIAFGSDRSPHYQINIKAVQKSVGNTGAEFISELDISTDSAYPQSQIIITQRLLSKRNINGYEFSQLKFNGVEVALEQLGDVKQFQTQRGSSPYLVLEQSYAIYPQAQGELSIEPSIASARLALNNRSAYDPFRSNTKTVRRASEKKLIHVKAIPDTFKGKHWLPAKEVQLVEELDTTKSFKIGEPITRTLSLFADGQTASQLPEFTITDVDGLKLYPDQPLTKDIKSQDGITGSQQIKVAIIPATSGRFVLPEITIPWWNTQSNKLQLARIPARTILVKAELAKTKKQPHESHPSTTHEVSATDPITQPAPIVQLSKSDEQAIFWKLTSLALVIGWALSLVVFWKLKSKKSRAKHLPDSRILSTKQSYKKLESACKANNAQACKTALLIWGNSIFIEPGVYSLGELARRVNELTEHKILGDKISQLNTHLYKNDTNQWRCDDLVSDCEKFSKAYNLAHPKTASASAKDSLEQLYK